ncbi:MAG TPA: hypothetical protein VG722_03355, partial [Tepidisphaeraceae bacterium]|nr:hypothetical protein [Tepidisphaeraceae bacterium]
SEALLDLTDIDHDQERVAKIRRALVYLHDHVRLPNGLYPKRWDTTAPASDKDVILLFQASAARGYAVAARFH